MIIKALKVNQEMLVNDEVHEDTTREDIFGVGEADVGEPDLIKCVTMINKSGVKLSGPGSRSD